MTTVLSLFAGIGGLDLGLAWAGFTTVGWCERDPFCRRVMEHHWPGLWNHDDITTLDPDDAVRGCGRIDLICGGFPCQPVSAAGKRRGTADARWLWPDMARVIRGIRPAWVLAENVPGLRNLGADIVLDDLEAAGYACWPVVVGAGHVGAPHQRQRVFVVANDASVRQRQGRSAETETAGGFQGGCAGQLEPNATGLRSGTDSIPARSREEGEGAANALRRIGEVEPDADGTRRAQATGLLRGRESILDAGLSRFPTPVELEQQAWEPARLVYQPRLRGSVDGVSTRLDRRIRSERRNRIKALGNAVVPQVAYVLGLAILRLDAKESTP